MSVASLRRTIRTLGHLKPMQAMHYLRKRGFGYSQVKPASSVSRRALVPPSLWLDPGSGVGEPWRFTFLNASREYPPGEIDWQPSGTSRLWRYNLHYFDFLLQSGRSAEVKQGLLNSWIANNDQGTEPGWEPYTASLRIVNWVKYFLQEPDSVSDAQMKSLFTQARWLRRNLELHILANHYFENIKALIFAGAYFDGREADSWLRFAVRELAKQLDEQTLADGCHYERTPSYHGIMVKNYLELYALVKVNDFLFSREIGQRLCQTAEVGLAFLQDILLPGERIPLFNDSAYDSVPQPSRLVAYGMSLGVTSGEVEAPVRVVSRANAGIYGYITPKDGVLFDCGDIGPGYQPGHTHCDFLSYELVLNGMPLVVDTGVYEYEPGPKRQYVRSTRAHNTVSVGADEQSEVWGEFRVARRARKLLAAIEENDDEIVFQGGYRGFFALGGNVEHHRSARIETANNAIASLCVTDTVTNAGDAGIESYIHLHPAVELLDDDGSGCLTVRHGAHKYAIVISGGQDYRLEAGIYCPEFGLKQENQCVVIGADAGADHKISYQIRNLH